MLRTLIATSTLVIAAGTLAVAAIRPVLLRQDMPQPTDQHRQLLSCVGTWEGTLTTFMPGEAQEPIPATETVEAIGPFWTQSRFECDFMGMPFVGSGCLGYDPSKEKFVGTWIDGMTTNLAIMEGEMEDDGKTLVMRWEGPDMATGEMTAHRNETVFDKDSYTSTFYAGEGDGEKMMVISMKRKMGKPIESGAVK